MRQKEVVSGCFTPPNAFSYLSALKDSIARGVSAFEVNVCSINHVHGCDIQLLCCMFVFIGSLWGLVQTFRSGVAGYICMSLKKGSFYSVW